MKIAYDAKGDLFLAAILVLFIVVISGVYKRINFMLLPEMLLVSSAILLLAMIAASLCRHLPIPYTVLLVITGLMLNFFSETLSEFGIYHFEELSLTSDLVLFIFLPALVFESALLLDARALLRNSVSILVLAIVGMLISTVLVGIGIWWSLELQIMVALLFGSLISATDPVAVVALFKELGVSKRLNILVEGESLMNDATAIVLFNILLLMLTKTDFLVSDGVLAVQQFLKVFIGGALVGVVIGLLMSELLVRLYHGNQSIPVVLSLILAYASFIIAEHEFHVSGVMAVLTAAMCLNISGLSRLSQKTSETIHETWEFIVLICNSFLFILIGLFVDLIHLAHYWQPILWAVIAVYIARAVSVYLLIPLTTRSFGLKRITWSERHIMWWGGLKGGLAIAVVLSIPDSLAEKELLVVLTLGVVLVSLLVNATTINSLMHFLKMDLLTDHEQAELSLSMQKVNQSTDKILHCFATLQLLDSKLESSVESKLHRTLDATDIVLSDTQLIKQVHLYALRAESEEIDYLYDIGVVNYHTLIEFKSILRIDQQHSIDYLQGMGAGWLQPNLLLDFERFIIQTLTERNWMPALLTRYQTRRFANKILHDIAGVLMAHKALDSIQLMLDEGLEAKVIEPIQHIYQQRLQRRQNRLQYFNENYAAFYRQYEAFLFQKVALRYSLKLVYKSYEQGLISAKVQNVIIGKLTHSLKQLSSLKIALRIGKRDSWIDKTPFFNGLPTACLQQLGNQARYVNFLPRDMIFSKGHKSDSLYIIISGKVKIITESVADEAAAVDYLSEGELIGLSKLYLEPSCETKVIAETYVSCLGLTIKDILRFSLQTPELAKRLATLDV